MSIHIKNINKKFGSFDVLKGANLEVKAGELTALLGPSGSGKTTLLRIIAGLEFADSGEVLLDGEDANDTHVKDRRVGFVFQHYALFKNMTVFDNVAFPLREHTQLNESMVRDIVLMKLEAVGLRGASALMPAQLSGGMARRVALARTIALDPELIMYDEPFTGQDPISLGVLVRLIKRLNELLHTTTIIVSHDVEETCSIADYIYLISGGKIIGQGSPEALMQSSEPQVKQFMHGEADGVVPFHYPARSYTEELLDA